MRIWIIANMPARNTDRNTNLAHIIFIYYICIIRIKRIYFSKNKFYLTELFSVHTHVRLEENTFEVKILRDIQIFCIKIFNINDVKIGM